MITWLTRMHFEVSKLGLKAAPDPSSAALPFTIAQALIAAFSQIIVFAAACLCLILMPGRL